MKNLIKALVATVGILGLFAMTPASAAHGKAAAAHPGAAKSAPAKTASDDLQTDLYTKRSVSGVLALENLHTNGSTCMTCSNGIYGTSGTHNMRSNEF